MSCKGLFFLTLEPRDHIPVLFNVVSATFTSSNGFARSYPAAAKQPMLQFNLLFEYTLLNYEETHIGHQMTVKKQPTSRTACSKAPGPFVQRLLLST